MSEKYDAKNGRPQSDEKEVTLGSFGDISFEEPKKNDTRNLGRRILDRILHFFFEMVPAIGDRPLEFIRKTIFTLALTTLVLSLTFILNDLVIVPEMNKQTYEAIQYDPDHPLPPPEDYDGEYPENMLESMKFYYGTNSDTRGYLRFSDTEKSWLNINYPVMNSDDNDYYLKYDFHHVRNKNGALFFDMQDNLDNANSFNKNLIIHGHNMASGQMFAKLNEFLTKRSPAKVTSATTIYLDTLYEQRQYQVFGVMLMNVRGSDGPPFNYLRNSFANDEDFMEYVANIRARSIYDFPDVKIGPEDELLMLSTCTARSGAKFDDGRLVVLAKKVDFNYRVSEQELASVKMNNDVIMPKAWYTNQGITLHPFYTDANYTVPNEWTPPTSTTETGN